MSEETKKGSENFALKMAQKITFPRLCGTEGEKKAQKIIRNELEKIGAEYDEDPVPWALTSWNILTPLLCFVGIITLAISVFYFVFTRPQQTYLGIIIVFIGILIFAYPIISRKGYYWGADSHEDSLNFIGKISPKSQTTHENHKLLSFTCHYDTKSQSVASLWRVVFIGLAGTGILAWLVFSLIVQVDTVMNGQTTRLYMIGKIGTTVAFVIATIGALGTASIRVGNKSPGALDNASGVGICMALAKYFQNNPLDDTEIHIGIFTGEELGLYGSQEYVKKYEDQYQKRNGINLNFDGVKTPIKYLTRIGSVDLSEKKYQYYYDLLVEASKQSSVEIKPFSIPFGVWTDSLPFAKRGFCSTSIISLMGASYVHRKGDSLDKLEAKALDDCTDLAIKFAEIYDEFE